MGAFPIFKGLAMRLTRIDACGKPIEGDGNRLATKGFVSVQLTPVMRDRQEAEPINAEGRVCFSGTTPATRKWHTAEIAFCGVDPELVSMLTGYEKVLGYDDAVIGMGDLPDIDDEFGVAVEVWTGGDADDDCPEPIDDSVLDISDSGKTGGYLLFGAREWSPMGNITISEGVADFGLSGITYRIPQWGRGPYNVLQDDKGVPSRLKVGPGNKRHYTLLRTKVAPPAPTDGAVKLSVKSIFTAASPYYGPTAAIVAPDQVDKAAAEPAGPPPSAAAKPPVKTDDKAA